MSMAHITQTTFASTAISNIVRSQKKFNSIQENLSTGKDVNEPIDNPNAYFTAKTLTARSEDLNRLLDKMSLAIDTVKTADEGLAAISEIGIAAEAAAQKALDSITKQNEITGHLNISDISDMGDHFTSINDTDTFSIRVGDKDKITSTTSIAGVKDLTSLSGVADTDSFDVTIGETTSTVAIASGDSIDDFLDKLNAIEDLAAKIDDNGKLEIKTTNNETLSLRNNNNTPLAGLGLDVFTDITIDDGESGEDIRAEIDAIDGITASFTEKGYLKIETEFGQDVVIEDIGNSTVAGQLGIEGVYDSGVNDRKGLAELFDSLIGQLDAIHNDTTLRGINLLDGDNLQVVFNETKTSTITLEGFTANATSFGINKSKNEWKSVNDINASIDEMRNAQKEIETKVRSFSEQLNVIKNREDITENMVETLKTGADKLTLTDLNEQAASLLVVQTRQQLATNSLSLATQWARSALTVF